MRGIFSHLWKVIQVGVMTGWRQDGCFSLVGEIARGMLLHIIDREVSSDIFLCL